MNDFSDEDPQMEVSEAQRILAGLELAPDTSEETRTALAAMRMHFYERSANLGSVIDDLAELREEVDRVASCYKRAPDGGAAIYAFDFGYGPTPLELINQQPDRDAT
ncbi:MAG: hypothetical protein N4A70_07370 [Pelagimonas sp.]|jgi:hypothetical protein|nr:hypothetical protein [Pelagimonas sp.]